MASHSRCQRLVSLKGSYGFARRTKTILEEQLENGPNKTRPFVFDTSNSFMKDAF